MLKTDELMEISWRYTRGYYNLEEAKQLIQLKIGLDESIAESLLKGLTRHNVRDMDFIRKERSPHRHYLTPSK